MATQFSGVPTRVPMRVAVTPIHGTFHRKYSPMPRQMRGGSASSSIAIVSIAPS
jgi:hypothetical protein